MVMATVPKKRRRWWSIFSDVSVVRTGELAADHLGGYDAAEALK
jgi:hypothetical protein